MPAGIGWTRQTLSETNALALCRNCHRHCHYASDGDVFRASLYEKVDRLETEPYCAAGDTFVQVIDPAFGR
jgi:hypothetical protein